MALQKTISRTTSIADLDWNRHVTSRTYERFCYDGRFSLLEDLGYSVHACLAKEIDYVSVDTFVRFLGQQFAESVLSIETKLTRGGDGQLFFEQFVIDKDNKKVCDLKASAFLKDKSGNVIVLNEIPLRDSDWIPSEIKSRLKHQEALLHDIHIPFSDMSCFWNLPSESIWKVFEEGRFLFFKEIVDLNLIKETDTTTFFMGGEIKIYKLPEPGEKIVLHSWIEVVEKIRFYFRQDIVNINGETLASMRDEQLFVALSSSRPRKAPLAFITKVEKYIEKK